MEGPAALSSEIPTVFGENMSATNSSDLDETDFANEDYLPGSSPELGGEDTQPGNIHGSRPMGPPVNGGPRPGSVYGDHHLTTPCRYMATTPYTDSLDSSIHMPWDNDIHRLYSLCYSHFWDDRDIRSMREEGDYTARIQSGEPGLNTFKQELFYLCRRNFPERLRILCDHITHTLRISLTSVYLRGDVSQTALHSALMHRSREAAGVTLQFGGKTLVLEPYSSTEHRGITALHIAVVKGMGEVVKDMLELLDEDERHEFIHAQASGEFYRTRFSASGSALTLAAWAQQMNIVDLLINYGAQLDASDSITGNNIFHSMVEFAVINPTTACSTFVSLLERESSKSWWAQKLQISHDDLTEDSESIMKNYLLRQTNLQGYTPLHLAARLGTCCIFTVIVNTENVYRFTQWDFGPAAMVLYDVTEIDSALAHPGSLSAMELLLRTVPQEKLEIFSTDPIQRLIKDKWIAYRSYYIATSFIHVFIMGLFTGIIFNTGPDLTAETTIGTHSILLNTERITVSNVLTLLGDVTILLYVVTRMVPWLYDGFHKSLHLMRARLHTGPSEAYVTSISDFLGLNPFDPISMVYYISSIIWFFMHILGYPHGTLAAGFALLSGWYLCLVYLRPLKNIAIFTVILNRIFTGDVLNFMTIFLVIFVAFSTSLMCFFGADKPAETSTFLESYWTLLRVMMGLYDLNDAIPQAAYPTVIRIVTFFFIIITMIQLLNMLIAAMNNTFMETSAYREHLWNKLLAEAIVNFESHLPRCLRPKVALRHRVYQDAKTPMINGGRWLLAVEKIEDNIPPSM